jgi:hypothetical protein
MPPRYAACCLALLLSGYGDAASASEEEKFACASEASRLPLLQKMRLYSEDFEIEGEDTKVVDISQDSEFAGWRGYFTHATSEEYDQFASMSENDGWVVFYFNEDAGKIHFRYMFGDEEGNCVQYPYKSLPIPLIGLPESIADFYYKHFTGDETIDNSYEYEKFVLTMDLIYTHQEQKNADALNAKLRTLPMRAGKTVPSPPSP